MIYLQDYPHSSVKSGVLKFFTYMKNIMSDKLFLHDPGMNKFIIVPYFFNSLHIHTFVLLNEALSISLVKLMQNP